MVTSSKHPLPNAQRYNKSPERYARNVSITHKLISNPTSPFAYQYIIPDVRHKFGITRKSAQISLFCYPK